MIYWPIITWLLQLVRILLLIYSKDLSSLQKSLFLPNQHRISQVKSRKQQFNLTLFAKRNLLLRRQRKHFYVKNEPTENYYYCIIRNIFLIQYFITLASSGTTPNEEKYIKKKDYVAPISQVEIVLGLQNQYLKPWFLPKLKALTTAQSQSQGRIRRHD